MKLGSLERAVGIAVRVDMNHANRPISAQRFKNRISNRMIATHRKWDHAGRTNPPEECLDIGMTLLETEATFHRHVPYVCCMHMQQWRDPQCMFVGADPLYRPNRAWAEPRSGAVGDAEIHRHADQRHIQATQIRGHGRLRPVRQAEKGCRARKRPFR